MDTSSLDLSPCLNGTGTAPADDAIIAAANMARFWIFIQILLNMKCLVSTF